MIRETILFAAVLVLMLGRATDAQTVFAPYNLDVIKKHCSNVTGQACQIPGNLEHEQANAWFTVYGDNTNWQVDTLFGGDPAGYVIDKVRFKLTFILGDETWQGCNGDPLTWGPGIGPQGVAIQNWEYRIRYKQLLPHPDPAIQAFIPVYCDVKPFWSQTFTQPGFYQPFGSLFGGGPVECTIDMDELYYWEQHSLSYVAYANPNFYAIAGDLVIERRPRINVVPNPGARNVNWQDILEDCEILEPIEWKYALINQGVNENWVAGAPLDSMHVIATVNPVTGHWVIDDHVAGN